LKTHLFVPSQRTTVRQSLSSLNTADDDVHPPLIPKMDEPMPIKPRMKKKKKRSQRSEGE
jgi:hypothetical protein